MMRGIRILVPVYVRCVRSDMSLRNDHGGLDAVLWRRDEMRSGQGILTILLCCVSKLIGA
jgi:hypothetical protein